MLLSSCCIQVRWYGPYHPCIEQLYRLCTHNRTLKGQRCLSFEQGCSLNHRSLTASCAFRKPSVISRCSEWRTHSVASVCRLSTTSPQLGGTSVDGASTSPLLPAARATPRRRLEKAGHVITKRFGGAAVHTLYGVHVASSYLLMLAAMTFNVGVFLAVCTGTASLQAASKALVT